MNVVLIGLLNCLALLGMLSSLQAMDFASLSTIENVTCLATALQNVDAARKTKIKEDIKTQKKTYFDLVLENQVIVAEVKSQSGQWENLKDWNLNNKGLKTALITNLSLPSYVNFEAVTYINFSHNAIKDLSLSFLAKKTPHLTVLNVSHNEIAYVSTQGKTLLKKLQHLYINNNHISEVDFEGLIRVCPALKAIDFSVNPLGEVFLYDKSIVHALHEDFALDIRNTNLSPENIKFLKVYCLACVHSYIKKGLLKDVFVGSTVGSLCLAWALTGLSPLAIGHFSLEIGAIGIPVAAMASTTIGWLSYKKEIAKHAKFYNLRSDNELQNKDEVIAL